MPPSDAFSGCLENLLVLRPARSSQVSTLPRTPQAARNFEARFAAGKKRERVKEKVRGEENEWEGEKGIGRREKRNEKRVSLQALQLKFLQINPSSCNQQPLYSSSSLTFYITMNIIMSPHPLTSMRVQGHYWQSYILV